LKSIKCTAGDQSLPPEWHPTDRVLLTWPHADGDWRDGLAAVENNFYALAETLLAITGLTISAATAGQASEIRGRLPAAAVFLVPSNDVWVRDHGPLTVLRGNISELIDANFNGWGNKYPAGLDNAVTAALHAENAFGEVPLVSTGLTLEGGAIEVDGNGTFMSRLCCLPTRDPQLSLQQLSEKLAALLGVAQLCWLEHGALEGDDTDAHIDTLARFLPGRRIVYQGCDDPSDSHFAGLKKLGEELSEMRDIDGQPYYVTALPWPEATHGVDGERLPLGYANFLTCNQHILFPTYGVPQDDAALACITAVAPDFTIVPVNCRALVQQYGSLHCATMQIPRPAANANGRGDQQQ